MEFGFFSLLPIALVFIIALTTKKVTLALVTGILSGIGILSYKDGGLQDGVKCVTDVLSNEWSLKSILFCLLLGAFVFVIDASGGVEGLVNYLTVKKRWITSGVSAQLLAYAIGIILFVDGVSSIVVAGVAGRALFDKMNVSRHKLAYIIDSTSSPVAWLFPFNAAGAFLMVMIGGQISAGVVNGHPFSFILRAIPFQLYGIVSILMVGIRIFCSKDTGTLKRHSNIRKPEEEPRVIYKTNLPHGIRPKAKNMVRPLLVLVILNFVILLISGKGSLNRGDGSFSLVLSALITLVVTGFSYIRQHVSGFKKYLSWCFQGMSAFGEIVIILGLAFSLSNVIKTLDTGTFIAGLLGHMNVAWLPLLVFLAGAIVSVATGTSGGTVAILIPIVLPLAAKLDANISLILGAIISSAVFGDHCSPISDSTILSSMIAEVPVLEHVRSQLPVALLCGLLSACGFLLLGFMI